MTTLALLVCACGGQDFRDARGYSETKDMQAASSNHKTPSSGDETRSTLGANAEILVKFKDEIDTKTIERIQRETGLRVLKVVSPPRLYLMEPTDGSAIEAMLERLKAYPEIIYAEPNRIRKLN